MSALLPPLLLLLLLLPSPLRAAVYRNQTSTCDGITRNLRGYSGIDVGWRPPGNYHCMFSLSYSASLTLSVEHQGAGDYTFSSECYRMSTSWHCPAGCVGLFYSPREFASTPIGVRYMGLLTGLDSGFLRLFYCSGRVSSSVFFVRSARKSAPSDLGDPVWRILGPVLATVCIMAAIFLVCVCYAQNFYRRDPVCCRSLHRRVRRLFRCEEAERRRPAAGAGRVSRDPDTEEVEAPPCRFVPPHIAAAEALAEEDRPPAYDDFHKYHRRGSFVSPPPYADAVAALSPQEGVANAAFLSDAGGEAETPAEVDLADGSRGAETGGEVGTRREEHAARSEGDSHC